MTDTTEPTGATTAVVIGRELDIEPLGDWTTVADPRNEAERFPYAPRVGDEPGRNIAAAYSVASPVLGTRFEVAVTTEGRVSLYEGDMGYEHCESLEAAIGRIAQIEEDDLAERERPGGEDGPPSPPGGDGAARKLAAKKPPKVTAPHPTPEWLRLWRARNMVSQSELAEALGVHVRTISKWETSQREIPNFLPLALEALERRRYETQEALRSGRIA